MKRNYVLRVSLKPLIPFIMIFGLYVQFHGDFGPGGGFQAGVIFAASIILYTLVFGLNASQRVFSRRGLERLMASGVLLYGLVGVLTMALGGNFLEYNRLAANPKDGQHYGILLIELGVGFTVAAVTMGLFFLFTNRARTREEERQLR